MKTALDGDLFVPVSISAIKDIETLAALFEIDSNHGRWSEPVGTKREQRSPRLVIRSARSKTYTNLQAQSVKNGRFRKDHRTLARPHSRYGNDSARETDANDVAR
jgi:hypothetical protein